MQFIDEVYNEYIDIIHEINPEEFAERWNKSVWKDVRMHMEV